MTAMRRDHLLGGAFVTVIAGCGGGATSDTGPADQTVQTAVASCSYANKFNSETECKDYVGEAWTVDQAEVDAVPERQAREDS